MEMDLAALIRNVPDFPVEGIGFKDITTLLKEGPALRRAIDELSARFDDVPVEVVVGVESRGFIIGAPIAYKREVGFVPVRKPGKLPAETLRQEYQLEYGVDSVEIHKDAISPGQKVLIVDDLLATGGTSWATAQLVSRLGGEIVGIGFLIELTFLKGRERLAGHRIVSLIQFDKE